MSDTIHPDMRAGIPDAELNEVVEDGVERRATADSYRHYDYVGDLSEHAGMIGWQNAAQKRVQQEHDKKLEAQALKKKRRAEAAGHKVETALAPVDEAAVAAAREAAEKFSKLYASRKAAVRDLYENGFYFAGGKTAGDHYEAFSEFLGKNKLRSHVGSPSLKLVPMMLPRRDRLRVGTEKDVLLSTDSKALGLLAPYVELDRKRRCAIIVELDTMWRSAEHLRRRLLEILPPHLMPHLITGRYTRDGLFQRPHLMWILRPDSWVWSDVYREWTDDDGVVRSIGDKACKTRPLKFFNAVQRALTALLIPLGADPGFHNGQRTKNPLSPFWSVAISNDSYWPELRDFFQIPGFTLDIDERAMEQQAGEIRAQATGASKSASNLVWRTVGNIISPFIRQTLATRPAEFIAAARDVNTLAAWIEQYVRPLAEAELGASPALDRTLDRRCSFAARYCTTRKPSRSRQRQRGRDRDLFSSDINAQTRREEAGRRSAAHRRAVSLWNIRKEMTVALMATGSFRKTEFIKSCTVSKSVAYKLWDEAVSGLGLEFFDGAYRKKAQDNSGININPLPAFLASKPSNPAAWPIITGCLAVQTIESPSINPGSGPPDPGNHGKQRHIHAWPVVSVPPAAVNHDVDPVVTCWIPTEAGLLTVVACSDLAGAA
jgi:hypothetical protein